MSDLIKREDTLTIIERLRDRCDNDEMSFALNWAANIIRDMTAVDAVPVKHGTWTMEEGYDGDELWVCSVCGETWFLEAGTPDENNMNYCPRCGAKMDGGNDATD